MITFDRVSFSYSQTEPEVIRNISLTISKGEYVAILGSNGSGKSTLARLMNGLLLPTQGEVRIHSTPTSDQSATHQIRQKVGMIFQNPENQLVASTVLDEVAFGLENMGCPQETMLPKIKQALQRVKMWQFRSREPHQLSGGQKQRVSIAAIMAMEPEVMICDESTSMLDPKGRDELLLLMEEMNKAGLTIIHITHDMDEALRASKVMVMHQGGICLEGKPEHVFAKEEELQQYGLALPFSLFISKKLREAGVPLSGQILDQEEVVNQLCRLILKA